MSTPQLASDGRFAQIRTTIASLSAGEADPTTEASVAITERVVPFHFEHVGVYWTATGLTLGDTVNLRLWVLDAPTGIWVLSDTANNVQAKQVAVLNCRAHIFHVQVQAIAFTGTVTNIKVFGHAPPQI